MLQEWKAMEKPEEEEIRARLAAAKEKLAKQQLLIKEQKIPVLVLMGRLGNRRKRFCDRSGDPEYRSAFLQGGIDGGKE